MSRIIVAGGPRTGKTTYARELALATRAPLRSTDDLIGQLSWSDASAEVARWLDEPGPWIIEGVAAVRALRKWFATHPGAPADLVRWASVARVARTPAQEAMAKGCATVWREVLPELVRRGIRVLHLP